MIVRVLLVAAALLFAGQDAAVAQSLPAVTVDQLANGQQTYSLSIQVLALMTALTVLPALILSMTAFTRIVIVLAILRQALGTPQTPPNQVLIGLALFLTLFVMSPVMTRAYEEAVVPYMAGEQDALTAAQNAVVPLREFMLDQVREHDLAVFADLSGQGPFASPQDVPLAVLIPSFITSELKTAFQIGFLIFIPFLVIDLVVASVLMSMGMMMLSPMLISLPFKIMLFVLVDGWTLLVGTLAASFFA
jgi:flagellar biosynthetic protein FliP